MAYDEGLAQRIREILPPDPEISEKRMFGGLAFLVRGKMFVGILGDVLMARVGSEAHDGALRKKHARIMDFAKRPMRGYVYVDPPGIERDKDLASWILPCLDHARSLPEKAAKKIRRKTNDYEP